MRIKKCIFFSLLFDRVDCKLRRNTNARFAFIVNYLRDSSGSFFYYLSYTLNSKLSAFPNLSNSVTFVSVRKSKWSSTWVSYSFNRSANSFEFPWNFDNSDSRYVYTFTQNIHVAGVFFINFDSRRLSSGLRNCNIDKSLYRSGSSKIV